MARVGIRDLETRNSLSGNLAKAFFRPQKWYIREVPRKVSMLVERLIYPSWSAVLHRPIKSRFSLTNKHYTVNNHISSLVKSIHKYHFDWGKNGKIIKFLNFACCLYRFLSNFIISIHFLPLPFKIQLFFVCLLSLLPFQDRKLIQKFSGTRIWIEFQFHH